MEMTNLLKQEKGMENGLQVLLLGDSVLMDGVAHSLKERRVTSLVYLEEGDDGIEERVHQLKPDLIVYEIGILKTETILSLLCEQDGVLLLALDISSSKVIIQQNHSRYASSMQELCEIILEEFQQRSLRKEVKRRIKLKVP